MTKYLLGFKHSAKSFDETRELLKKRRHCDDDADNSDEYHCKGWCIFDADGGDRGARTEVEVCLTCAPKGLCDEDVAVLPEAIDALRERLQCKCTLCAMRMMARSFASVDEERVAPATARTEWESDELLYIECAACNARTYFGDFAERVTSMYDPEPFYCLSCHHQFLEEDDGEAAACTFEEDSMVPLQVATALKDFGVLPPATRDPMIAIASIEQELAMLQTERYERARYPVVDGRLRVLAIGSEQTMRVAELIGASRSDQIQVVAIADLDKRPRCGPSLTKKQVLDIAQARCSACRFEHRKPMTMPRSSDEGNHSCWREPHVKWAYGALSLEKFKKEIAR